MRRRDVFTTGLCCAAFGGGSGRARADDVSFDQLLAQATADDSLLESGRSLREGPRQVFEQVVTMGIRGRPPRSNVPISDRASALIESFEITSPGYYDKRLQGPTWPNGDSGVTIGIGYDVGYATAEWLQEDWEGYMPNDALARLKSACEITGPSARAILGRFADIRIAYAQAKQQFDTNTRPRAVGETAAALPNIAKLSPDSLGALVSLTYNRGPSFQANGLRYAEMRAIRLHMVKGEFEKIPAELRGMKRLWEGDPDMRGLLIRRDLEAKLFEEGLRGT